jgi:hypothetical protein
MSSLRCATSCKMFGVPLEGPAQVYCDNQGVVKNTSIPESVLSKKHNAINYHAVPEAAAAGVLEVHKEDTQTNLPMFPTSLFWSRYLLRDYVVGLLQQVHVMFGSRGLLSKGDRTSYCATVYCMQSASSPRAYDVRSEIPMSRI